MNSVTLKIGDMVQSSLGLVVVVKLHNDDDPPTATIRRHYGKFLRSYRFMQSNLTKV
jgi:hypothetical protein